MWKHYTSEKTGLYYSKVDGCIFEIFVPCLFFMSGMCMSEGSCHGFEGNFLDFGPQ